jgi:hypothetical protein
MATANPNKHKGVTMTLPVENKKSVALSRLWWAALIAGAVAAVGNLIVFAVARALNLPLEIPMGPQTTAPLTAVPVIATSFIPALLAAAFLALLSRFVSKPLRVFQIVGLVAALLSLLGPSLMPIAGATKVILILMHLVAAISIIGVLSVLARVRQS